MPHKKSASGFSSILICGICIVLLSAVYVVYIGKTQPSTPISSIAPPTPSPSSSAIVATATPLPTPAGIYTYPALSSLHQSLTHINLISAYFVAQDQNGTIKPEWQENQPKVLNAVGSFFSNQFQGKINFDYSIDPGTTHGDYPLNHYDFSSARAEIYQKTQSLAKKGSFNLWLVYVVRDSANVSMQGDLGGISGDGTGLNANIPIGMVYEFWLDNEAVNSKNPYGTEGAAHEVGHTLGIPHPWDLPANTSGDANYGNVPGSLMAYSNNGLPLDQLYIRDDVKKEMGL